jgi:hypothetical protein
MALATVADVALRLGRDLTTTETSRAEGLLEEASALVIGYLGCDPTDTSVEPPTVPAAVAIVVSRMVARVLQQSASVEEFGSEATTDSTGPFSTTVRYGAGTTSGAPWLTKVDKLTLRPFRCDGGFSSVAISAGTTGRYRREVS